MNFFEILRLLSQGIGQTLLVTLVCSATALAFALVMISIRTIGGRPSRLLVDAAVYCLRGIPVLVLLFLVYFGLPLVGLKVVPLAAMALSLGLIGGAYMTEVFRGALDSVDPVELMAAEFRVAGGGLARDVASDDLDTDSGVVDTEVGAILLSAKALKYLERLPTSAISVAGESQREIAGELVLTEVRGGVGTLSLVSGGKAGRTKGVKLNKLAPYTYHSHPEDAYTSSGVGMVFPSVNDYTIFFVNRTMKVHFVASLEGLYVLSRAESEVDDVSASEFKKILEDSFIASKTNGMSGSSHANAMTELGFFRVSFLQWIDVGTSDILNI